MDISQNGLKFIKDHEGCVLHPYNDAAGYATIGIGRLIAKRPVNEADKKQYAVFTETDALNLLHTDVSQFVQGVNTLVTNKDINQNQFDAMVSLAFNVGMGNFANSSVLRFTNTKQYDKASAAFLLWNKAGGKVLAGLTKRRQDEANLYLTKALV